MRISNSLRSAVGFNPTKMSHQKSIVDMCKKIDVNSMTLPLYQRDLSWTLEKAVDLLNYQLNGKAPVSPISINTINTTIGDVPQVSFISREIVNVLERGQWSVVDGQQRITTNYKAYINDTDFRNVVLDLGKGKFIINELPIRSNQLPVGILLNKDDNMLYKYIEKNPQFQKPEIQNLLIRVRTKIMEYNYTINMAEDLSEDEQIQWFEVLNNAGSRVSIIQMRFSKLKAHGIDIYKDYTTVFNNKLLEAGYDFFTPEKTTVSYPIAALNPSYEILLNKSHKNNFAPIPSDTKENQLCSLSPEQLQRCIDMTLIALDKVLDFIEMNELNTITRIDYINYLIGFFVYNPEYLNNKSENALLNWYNNVDFTNKSNSKRRQLYTELLTLCNNQLQLNM